MTNIDRRQALLSLGAISLGAAIPALGESIREHGIPLFIEPIDEWSIVERFPNAPTWDRLVGSTVTGKLESLDRAAMLLGIFEEHEQRRLFVTPLRNYLLVPPNVNHIFEPYYGSKPVNYEKLKEGSTLDNGVSRLVYHTEKPSEVIAAFHVWNPDRDEDLMVSFHRQYESYLFQRNR